MISRLRQISSSINLASTRLIFARKRDVPKTSIVMDVVFPFVGRFGAVPFSVEADECCFLHGRGLTEIRKERHYNRT